MKNNLLLLAAIGAGLIYYEKNKKNSPIATNTGITDSAKRASIIAWWETHETLQQSVSNPLFEDVINNISPSEIDIIYNYVFSYLAKGLTPVPGSMFEQQIDEIKKYYNIFQ